MFNWYDSFHDFAGVSTNTEGLQFKNMKEVTQIQITSKVVNNYKTSSFTNADRNKDSYT